MPYDIFLSHSSADSPLLEKAKAELVAAGYSVFVDSDALPHIRPEEVTGETAEMLRRAMRECTSLLYLISATSGTSRWMPWELGYFDGFSGRVFVYPMDRDAAATARGREYLKIYPLVPLAGRSEFLRSYVPKSTAQHLPQVVSAPPRELQVVPPLFEYAQQEATVVHGRKLLEEMPRALGDPVRALGIVNELIQAYWRLWGLMPQPRRPGAEEGRWD